MNQSFLTVIAFAILAIPSTSKKNTDPISSPTKTAQVTVYTTAENSSLRLTKTATLQFSPYGQPFETEPAVFVDPNKSFQTFVGIGGALTDASAETFAKLPKNKQAELLDKLYG
ncbi:MAG: hypothetical protein B7Y76_04515, partial [Sphingobacteriia bacterium 35-40-5]